MSKLGEGVDFCGPGCWRITHEKYGSYLEFECPCGCGDYMCIPISTAVPKPDNQWSWDGNEEVPTIAPSIRRMERCRWHGFFTAGKWDWCNDGPPCVGPLAGKQL